MTLLHQKLDYLTEQLDAQRRRQQVLEELWRDMVPIGNSMTQLMINELEEVGNDFELEDILHLFKRLLRDVRLITGLLDRLESFVELIDELKIMTTPAFSMMVENLEKLENKGYFAFANNTGYIVDQIVTEFDEEDVRALGDNIVTILTTVRNMTQPDIMALVNNAVQKIEAPVDEDISMLGLLREMRDPEVRSGLARLLNMVKALSDQPENQGSK